MTAYVVSSGQVFTTNLGPTDTATVLSGGETSGITDGGHEFVSSGGARMQEGTAALAGYGRIFRETVALTGVVPQISIVSGASAGGGAYSPALTDLIVMTEDAAMFLTGPGVVRDALGEEIGRLDTARLPAIREAHRVLTPGGIIVAAVEASTPPSAATSQ